MDYINNGTSTSARNNIQFMQFLFNFRDSQLNKGNLTYEGNNNNLMLNVSNFRYGLRKQRKYNLRRKHYSPYAERIQIPRWSM